jgi:hypothetical protein
MPEERRYDETEIQRIFELAAAETVQAPQSTKAGLTLSELQSIGHEVGIPDERVAAAAGSLDSAATPTGSYLARIPLGVEKSFSLARSPSDHEWAVLVTELRRVFGAEGVITSTEGLREWRNGNLHATVEPTVGGYWLRLGTKKGQARLFGAISAGWFIVALGVLADGSLTGGLGSLVVSGLFLTPLARLPSWAKTRESQMEYLGTFAARLLASSEAVTDNRSGDQAEQ